MLRALSGGERLTAAELCREELLPQQFVYKILKKLERAGIVELTRGADGGCRLTADLRKVSLYDLTQCMEADGRISACMQPGFQCAWRQKNGVRCAVHEQLADIQRTLDSQLRERSLHQVLFEKTSQ